MKRLIIFPTKLEAEAFLSKNNHQQINENLFISDNNDVLISGPGIPASMMNIMSHLYNYGDYDMLILAGLAGSIKKELKTEDVLCVVSENFADIGVNKQGFFDPLYNHFEWKERYRKGKIINPHLSLIKKTNLDKVSSNTVNICNLGLKSMPVADIENMEGASFFLIAENFKIPYLEIRSISNYAGERDKNKWKINESLESLSDYLTEFLNSRL